MGFRNKRAMPKKKTDTEKKVKAAAAVKPASKKVAEKPEKKSKPAPALAPAAVPAPITEAPKAAPAAEKPKLTLPKKPAQIKRAAITITIEDISLRAYFIAERRKSMGWLGDETSDWVEAERQLVNEAAKKQS